MVLKECPAYEDCLLWHRTHGWDKEFFHCDGCISYKCYELGFMQGAKEAIRKINELPDNAFEDILKVYGRGVGDI